MLYVQFFRIKSETSVFLKHVQDMELDFLLLTHSPSYLQCVYKIYVNFKRKKSKRSVPLLKLKIPTKQQQNQCLNHSGIGNTSTILDKSFI